MRLRSVLREKLPTPAPLRELAGIRRISLFVTTTFDSLMEQAINEERYGGAATDAETGLQSRGPRRPAGGAGLGRSDGQEGVHRSPPMVYHLLGRSASTVPDCVLTQEHMLEYFHRLQRDGLPERLFDMLQPQPSAVDREPALRLAGPFSDPPRQGRPPGLTAGFHRDSRRLHEARRQPGRFLRSYSRSTQVFDGGDAMDFVAELSRRYNERHPAESTRAEAAAVAAASAASPAKRMMPEGADLHQLCRRRHGGCEPRSVRPRRRGHRRLARQEQVAGRRRVRPQDQTLHPQLLGVRARHVAAHAGPAGRVFPAGMEPGGSERSIGMDETVRFIIPVVIDDTPEDERAHVPGAFLLRHWMRLAEGNCDDTFHRADARAGPRRPAAGHAKLGKNEKPKARPGLCTPRHSGGVFQHSVFGFQFLIWHGLGMSEEIRSPVTVRSYGAEPMPLRASSWTRKTPGRGSPRSPRSRRVFLRSRAGDSPSCCRRVRAAC